MHLKPRALMFCLLPFLQGRSRRLRPLSAIPGEPDKDFGLAPESGTGGSNMGRSQGTARPLSGADNAGDYVVHCLIGCCLLCISCYVYVTLSWDAVGCCGKAALRATGNAGKGLVQPNKDLSPEHVFCVPCMVCGLFWALQAAAWAI
jgi:hypothetical protein